MGLNRLSAADSEYIFKKLLDSQKLAPASKEVLSSGGGGSGDKDLLEAAKAVMPQDGKTVDDFDLDKNGQLNGQERDGFIDALVALLSDPQNAKAFMNSLNQDSGKDKAAIDAAHKATARSPAQATPAASGGGGASGAGGGGGASGTGAATAAQNADPTGAGAVGGASEASEFGTDKKVDPSKNFASVPDGKGGSYTVDDCAKDIMKLAESDTRERGPKPTAEQAQKLAQGIINGTNNYFDKSTDPKATAQALIASAWKESKFNFGAGNGGVFQCANNRFEDWKKAHPDSSMTHAQMSTSGDPAASIDVALWAMAHPVPGMGKPGRALHEVPAGGSADKALYFWNYNDNPAPNGSGKTELDDYMEKTKYFRSLLDS